MLVLSRPMAGVHSSVGGPRVSIDWLLNPDRTPIRDVLCATIYHGDIENDVLIFDVPDLFYFHCILEQFAFLNPVKKKFT